MVLGGDLSVPSSAGLGWGDQWPVMVAAISGDTHLSCCHPPLPGAGAGHGAGWGILTLRPVTVLTLTTELTVCVDCRGSLCVDCSSLLLLCAVCRTPRY